MNPTRRLVLSGVLLLTIVGVGAAGYGIIEGWPFSDSVFMAIITISTVGYEEVHPLSSGGKVFSSLLIVGGVGVMFYSLSAMVQYVVEGELQTLLVGRRVKARLRRTKDHFIICGYGRVGRQVASQFAAEGQPFVVVEGEASTAEAAIAAGHLVVPGSATEEAVLRQAGIERARGLVSVVDSDADNTYVVLTARGLRPDIFVVARADSKEAEAKLRLAGADRVISPYAIAGQRMAHLVMRPLVVDYLDMMTSGRQVERFLETLAVGKDCPVLGATVEEVRSEYAEGAQVLALMRADGELLANPSPEVRVQHGDRLVVIGTREQLDGLAMCLGAWPPGA